MKQDQAQQDSLDAWLETWKDELPGVDLTVEGIVDRIHALRKYFTRSQEETLRELDVGWAEYDVVRTLRVLGHEVRVIGVHDDLTPIRATMDEFKPTITFNLMEMFADIIQFDQNVVSYLELLGLPYTGCNPRGLILARDKALSKKLLAYHRIRRRQAAQAELGEALLPATEEVAASAENQEQVA